MLSVLEIRRTAAFRAHHAGPDRTVRRAARAEERTFRRDLHAAQDIAAGAKLGLRLMGDLGVEPRNRIKGRIVLSQLQTAVRNNADPAPVASVGSNT